MNTKRERAARGRHVQQTFERVWTGNDPPLVSGIDSTDIGIGIGIGIDADCGADGYDSDVFASRAQTSSAWSQLSQEVFTGWERMAIEKRLKEATAHGSVDHECGLSRP